jgi:hypothetical protein
VVLLELSEDDTSVVVNQDRNWYSYTEQCHIKFKPIKNFSVIIKLNLYQKKLELDFSNSNSSVKIHEVIDFIQNRNKVTMAKNNSWHNSYYSLKYTEKNCQRLVDILFSLFTEFFANRRVDG